MIHNTRISIIVAIDEKRGIGKNNDLLFKIPEDFKRMKSLTSGHPLIMGRKTYESIGRPLPNRTNIVVSRDSSFARRGLAGVIVVHSLEEALRVAQGKEGSEEIFVFGGGQIFKEALEKNLVDRLYLTIVKGDYDADAFFPDYSGFKTVVYKKEGKSNGYSYTFLDVEK